MKNSFDDKDSVNYWSKKRHMMWIREKKKSLGQ